MPSSAVDRTVISQRITPRESVHFIRKMMQLAPDIVHIHAMQGQRILYVNHRLEDVLGYTPDDLARLGGSLRSAVVGVDPAELDARITQLYERAADGEIVQYELTMRHKNGSLRTIRTRGSVFRRDDAGRPLEVMGISEDITAERQAEQELRDREALARRILELAPDSIAFYNLVERRSWFVGHSAWIYLGYTQEEAAAEGLSFHDFIWDDAERASVQEHLARFATMLDGETLSYRSRLRHRNGSLVVFLQRATVFRRDAQGNPLEIMVFYQDVSQQEKAAERIRQQEHLLREAERTFQYGSWEWDCGASEVIWSGGMFALYDLNPQDFPDCRVSAAFFRQCVDETDWKRLTDSIQQAVETRSAYQLEHGFTDPTGTRKRFQVRGKVLTDVDGRPTKVIGTTTDVTRLHEYEAELARRIDELDRANHELRRSEALLAQTEKLLNYGSWAWDVQTDSTYWSDGHYRIFGYHDPADRPVSITAETFLSHIATPDDVTMAREAITLALTQGEPFEYESQIVGHDGQTRTIRTQGKAEIDATGRVTRLVGSTTDITQLREYETRLQEKIDALNRSNRELEQFAYVASHDLQEPLRKITAFGERLATRFGDSLGPDGGLFLDRMLDAAGRMRVLIDDLLNFSRLTRQNEPFVRTNLTEVFRNVLGDLEIKIQEKGAHIDWEPLPTIQAVPSQMRQLFQNLLANALKFTRTGVTPHIRVEVESVAPALRTKLSLEAGRRYTSLVVQDNGIGFDPEFAERVFVLFQRLHGRSEYEGTGIGLAICRKIVDHHQGRIFAESHPGQGARFTVVLPFHH